MIFVQSLPWILLAAALGAGLWLHRRYRAELETRAQLEAVLRTTENTLRRFSQAVESASDAIGIADFEGNSVYHNRAHLALFGYTVDELNAVPEPGPLFTDKKIAVEIQAGIRAGRSWSGETELKTKDGRRLPALVRADVIFDEQKRPVGIFSVFTDVTDRRRAAAALDAERRRLSLTLQSIADGIITTDARGRVELMNRVAEKLTGWTQLEAQRLPLSTVFRLLDEAQRAPREPALARAAADPFDPLAESACILVTRDGRERVITEKSTLLTSAGDAAGTVVVFRDITAERRQADERERGNKLESLGLLAGGMAHDFSNLLTSILGHLTQAQDVGLPAEVAGWLGEVERASWRAKDLTQQLLTFAKGGTPVKKTVQLDGIIRESVGFALHGATKVTARFVVPPTLWLVDADPGQLGQVINNLALNAVQAMGERASGTLLVTAENVETPLDQTQAFNPARSVRVSIADNGPGISPENLTKIFDPFFTTKTKGTGLGLATAYSIIKKHGGRVHVESSLGHGSTFHIFLPASPAGSVATTIATAAPFPVAANAKPAPPRVLLMDDEQFVREALAMMLVMLGYEVESAREGQEAIDLFQKARDAGRPFNIVILDLRVPAGLGGAETIKRLRAIDPKLKALVASGYSEDPVIAGHRGVGFDAAVAKPFKIDDLSAVLEQLNR